MTDWGYLCLIGAAMIPPPEAQHADWIVSFLPLQIHDWLLVVGGIWAFAYAVLKARVLRRRVGKAVFAVTLMLAVGCLSMVVGVSRGREIQLVFREYVFYGYWLALLIPFVVGPLRSWKRLIWVLTGAVAISATIAIVAFGYNHELFRTLAGVSRGHTVGDYVRLSARLPVGGVYLIPFLTLGHLSIISEERVRSRRVKSWITIACLITILVAAQSRTILIISIAAVLLYAITRSERQQFQTAIIGTLILLTTMVMVGGLILESSDAVRAVFDRRVLDLAKSPTETLQRAFTGPRERLYEYSLTTLKDSPIIGRGLGAQIITHQGYTALRQDVSILNHLDNAGILGATAATIVHLLLLQTLLKIRRQSPTRGATDETERKIRNNFILYYPLVLIAALNYDVLYSSPFMIVHGLLVGSLLVEADVGRNGKRGAYT